MDEARKYLWDSRANACGGYSELYVPQTVRAARKLKGFRNADYQAICPIQIDQAPRTEDELAASDDAKMLVTAMGPEGGYRYQKAIILREHPSADISGVVETIRTFCPGFIEQGRLFVADLPEDFGPEDFDRATGAARVVSSG